ncbi:hypothetical protein, partial [Streptomyces ehimensis]
SSRNLSSTVAADAAPPSPLAMFSLVTGAILHDRSYTVPFTVPGLADLLPPALQATGELVACAALFEPGQVLYLSVGWQQEGVRIVVWDPHTRHVDPDSSGKCAARRNKMLYLLACVVHECKGSWGVIRPAPAREGTRVWVNLPRQGAADYAAALC